MKLPRLLSLSLIFVLVLAASAQAEWWRPSMPKMPSLPNLNPFKQRSSHPADVSNQEDSWHLPGTSKKPPPEPQEVKPSMWQRVSSGTKSTWTKTKSTLTPWRAKPQPEEEIVVTGSNSSFHKMANGGGGKQPAKKAYWAWGNDDEEDRPQKASSVSDFIGGRRPD